MERKVVEILDDRVRALQAEVASVTPEQAA
jgi:hypothetical protein